MDAKQITPSPFFGFPQPILDALDRQIQFIGKIVERELDKARAREVANLVATTKECRCENNGDYCEWCGIQFDYMQADPAEQKEMLNNAKGK